MPAYLEPVIEFEFGDPLEVLTVRGGWETSRPRSVVGPHTSVGTLRFQGKIDTFAIFLQPAAMWTLFRVPTSGLMETHYDADDVLGAPVSDLWEILAGTLEFGARVRAAERYLFRWANFEECNTVSTTAAALLAGSAGRVSIHNLATHFNVSVRQLERSFLSEMGVTPKRFARVARFQAALDTRVRMPDRSWLAIATDSGYHDQMHLVHDFVDFAGLPPTLTVKQLGDSRPSALAAANRVNDN